MNLMTSSSALTSLVSEIILTHDENLSTIVQTVALIVYFPCSVLTLGGKDRKSIARCVNGWCGIGSHRASPCGTCVE